MAKRRRRRHSAIFFFFRPFFFTILFPFCGAFETQRFVGAESLQSSREGGAGLRVPSRVGGGGGDKGLITSWINTVVSRHAAAAV